MATSITKEANGNVLIVQNSTSHSVPPFAKISTRLQDDDISIFYDNREWLIHYSDVVEPVTASRDELFDELRTNFFFSASAIVNPSPLPTLPTQQGESVDVNNPLPTDSDSIYSKDINITNSNKTDWTGNLLDLFGDPFSTGIDNSTLNNTKVLDIAFNRTIYANSIGLGCNSATGFGSSITLYILGSQDVIREQVSSIGDANSRLISFESGAFNKIRLEFNTASPVCLTNITARKEHAVSARIQGIGSAGQLANVRVTNNGDLGVDLPRDIFGNMPISEQFSIWDSTRVFSYLLPLFYTDYLTGGATNIHNKDTSSNTLSVGVGEMAATQLKTRTKYQPLKAHKVAVTGTFTQEAGVEKFFGYADLDNYTSSGEAVVDGTIYNGIGCLVAENEVYIQLFNNGVQTLPGVDGVAKSDWNIDKLDGNGPSRITLDFNYSQIGLVELEWLGVGALVLYYNMGGVNIPVHIVENANMRVADVYMRTANLSPLVLIRSIGGAGSVKAICNAVISGGGHNPIGVPRAAETNTSISVANNVEEAILFIRLRPEAYEATVDITGFKGITESSGDCKFRLRYNPIWNGSALTFVNEPNSHIQVAQAQGNNLITAPGIKMDVTPVASATDSFSAVVSSKLKLGKTLQANANQLGRYDVIVLTAEGLKTTEVYQGVINYVDNG